MSRWHLTSNKEMDAKASRCCANADLLESGKASSEHCHIRAYFKRAANIGNFVDLGDDQWICVAGTIIYDGSLGVNALHAAFRDFGKFGVSAVQSQAIGHYAVAIKYADEVTVFTDPLGLLSLNYYIDDSSWVISNSLQLCAITLPALTLDPTIFMVNALDGLSHGEETFYRGIKRLFGTQAIRIALPGGQIHVEDIPVRTSEDALDNESISGAVDQYKSIVGKIFSKIAAVGPIGILGTGGLDSRTVLAATMHAGATPQIMYGVGNSRMTDYCNGDLLLSKHIAKHLGLAFQQLDWSGNHPHDEETLENLFWKFGFIYDIYGSPQGLISGLSGNIDGHPALILGGRASVFTQKTPWAIREKRLSFNFLIDYISSYIVKTSDFTCFDEYKSELQHAVQIALKCGRMEYEFGEWSLDNFVNAYLFLDLRNQARFLNFANEFCHYIDPFMLASLHDPLVNLPPRYREYDKFQVRLIHSLEPSLIDIPLYSAYSSKTIDHTSFSAKDVDQKSRIGRIAESVLPASALGPTRMLYHAIKPKAKPVDELQGRNGDIIREYGPKVLADPLLGRCLKSTHELQPGAHIKILARLRHLSVGARVLGYPASENALHGNLQDQLE